MDVWSYFVIYSMHVGGDIRRHLLYAGLITLCRVNGPLVVSEVYIFGYNDSFFIPFFGFPLLIRPP